MQSGILGFPKVGKTTLFNILTASHGTTDKFVASRQANVAVARVPDTRLERLRDLFQPRRYTPATVEYVDIPGLRKGEGRQGLDVARLRDVDVLVHMVRAFADEDLVHSEGSVDPGRDMANLELELVLADHELVERRLERLRGAAKRGLRAEEAQELELLETTVLPSLEEERPLRELELGPEPERRLRGFQLLSAKPLLVVLNLEEGEIGKRRPEDLGFSSGMRRRAMAVSAPLEAEIATLAPQEQREFLDDLGLEEPSLDRVIRATYELLGLVSFFTVGEDEVRAWTIRQGTTAREAGGSIHSDIARGFIRAEVVGWEDLLRLGSLAACRSQGLLRLEGKDYLVRDGEVVHFRFNV